VICLGADKDDYVVDTWPAFRLGINGVFPTGFAGGETLQVAVDRGSTQTITFTVDDQTLALVIDRINLTLTDALASDTDGELRIETTSRGLNSHLEVVGGTGMVQLGHRATTAVGHGGVKVGDFFEFRQSIDVTAVTLLTFKCKMRQPPNTDIKFKLSVVVGGAERLSVEPNAGVTVDFVTRYINVADLAGAQNVGFMIEAVPA
jgi:hypothetical protein